MSPQRKLKEQEGFSILDAMMAAIILVVGFIGLLEAMALGSHMMDNARRQTLAAQIITNEIDKLRFASWTTVSSLPVSSTAIAIDSQFNAAIASSGATFTLTRTLTTPDPDTNIKEVNFTVTWVVASNRSNSGTLLRYTYSRTNSAYIGKYGLNLSYQRS